MRSIRSRLRASTYGPDGLRGERSLAMAPVTFFLILLNVGVFALQAVSDDGLVTRFALWPIGQFHLAQLDATVGFRAWQLVTSAFLHGSATHLLLNMFGLYMFGRDVERQLGPGRYLALYFAAVLTASTVQLGVVSILATEPYPTVGASGGIYGILLAFAVFYPRRIVTLLFPPISMRAWVFVTAYAALELVSGILGTQAGVAHFAHLGGMLGAFLLLTWWKRRETTFVL
jgi:membrane associated rhomboid family serine protease